MIVFGSPSRYVQGAGARHRLGEDLRRFGSEAMFITDPGIDERDAVDMMTSCARAGVRLRMVPFDGECTHEGRDALLGAAGATKLVVAAGGGKCLDMGKAIAHQAGAEVATVPTIASTDAPTSHIYVMYDTAHRMLGVEKMPRNPALVVVDTEIIARAPRALFVAGLGDAIGKIHEVEACVAANGINVFGGTPPAAAMALARVCHDTVLRHAEAALAAIDRGTPDQGLEATVEATILMSGLAFESGGLSIAHSMTRGLTAVPRYAAALHGLQVAYANLVQLRLEGRPPPEIDALAAFYARIGLPRSLAELAAPPSVDDIATIAALTMTAPHVGHVRQPVDRAQIGHAMDWVERRYAGRAAAT
jgi:glycerol dehydrogenase